MAKDILIYETGSGGDLAVINGDISLNDQLLQQVYLCLFGGNVEASTKGDELPGQIREDWWGNSLLFGDNQAKQFNSETECALRDNPLNGSGRNNIIQAVNNDLKHFKSYADVKVDASVTGTSSLKITIKIQEPQNSIPVLVRLMWDNAKSELIFERAI